LNKLKLLDLFSGIGGFSLGFEKTGSFETIAFCEKDEFCKKVLRKHWNHIRIYDEIRNLNGKEIKADVVTGGFPCQPFSVAGKRKGTDDDRYLWDETLRVIAETKPTWFVGENVEGIVNISEGKVLQQIQKDLESEGFQVQCLIIPASGVGAWHQRKRVWIIAYSDNNGLHRPKRNATIKSGNEPKDRLSIRDDKDVSNSSSQRPSTQSVGDNRELEKESKGEKETRNKSSLCASSSSSDVPNSERLRNGRRSSEECGIEERKLQQSEQKRSSLRSEAERCGSQTISNSNSKRLEMRYKENSTLYRKDKRRYFSELSSEREKESWWQTQSELCGVPNGISYELDKDRANRIKALGNSIVPEIAYEIAKAILVAENEQSH